MNRTDAAVRFGGYVLAHAAAMASELKDSELLCPFAIITKGDQHEVIPFEAESQEDAISIGQSSLDACKPRVDFWALAREGIWSSGGEGEQSIDVLVVSAWTHGLDEPVLLMLPFSPTASGRFSILGMVEIAIDGEVQTAERAMALRRLAMTGVERHPSSARWSEWVSLEAVAA